MLIIVCGLPGVGKSFFAKKLAEKIGAEHLSSDHIRMNILEERTYSEEEKGRIYELMAEEAQKLLIDGKKVIADATFYLEKYRTLMKHAAEKSNVQFNIIECTLDESELKKRMEKRGGEKTESEADFDVYLKVKKIFEPVTVEHLEVDTALPIEENLNKAIIWMRSK